ncbi:hypothetical protein [Aquimarina agarilytica]|uniref:hypothetical protein n=1 Tax=Aquimarina agarilytica TaxID=1087449 RepID=UPI000289D8F7|nr:hypothetical protein [Aquimarina agarilytica]
MDLQADIQWIQKELSEVRDPNLIEAFKNLLKYRIKNKSNTIDLELYNQELEASEKEIEEGHFHTQEQVRKIASQWGRK